MREPWHIAGLEAQHFQRQPTIARDFEC